MKNQRILFYLMSLLMAASLMTFTACDGDDDDDPSDDDDQEMLVGVQGKWQSSGSNVAPLLVLLVDTDSIYAEFKTDMTYVVENYDKSGALVVFEGTYTQTITPGQSIAEITINQSTPSVGTSVGIFEVTGNTMKYEVVQTVPDFMQIPPTVAGGFGSTNMGANMMDNVQTFVRIE
ncbi:MAG: hypothetical protein AAGI38_14855 [Bacteroidota bacterium]